MSNDIPVTDAAPVVPSEAMAERETELRARLRLPETRANALATIKLAVRETGTVKGAAAKLGVVLRTLQRLIDADPELKALVAEERSEESAEVGERLATYWAEKKAEAEKPRRKKKGGG